MSPGIFNQRQPTSWPLFTTVEKVRSQLASGTKVMVAIGGWGDTKGFSEAARTKEGRKIFAENVGRMVKAVGPDGVDIDWEYPGGNGEDYKQNPNSEKAWEISAYPKLLAQIRSVLGDEKLISAAVPGLRRDMLAFTKHTVPEINASLDFFNVMTYDLMNRRDTVTKHHTGLELSLNSVDAYAENGVPADKMNLGFAFYVKWFQTDPKGGCDTSPIGCKTMLMEDPTTGVDLGRAGGFSWHDAVPAELSASFAKAVARGQYDNVQGGHYYWDREENRWWSWDTPEAIAKKFPALMKRRGLGGAFAWGLGEDAEDFVHLKALTQCMNEYENERRGRTLGAAEPGSLPEGSRSIDEL
ncbi:hypothetical protein MMC07_004768 [Pseudocyphellaria aurata]|nr:hypothetical protein [Pseudocyphellaria aurata]